MSNTTSGNTWQVTLRVPTSLDDLGSVDGSVQDKAYEIDKFSLWHSSWYYNDGGMRVIELHFPTRENAGEFKQWADEKWSSEAEYSCEIEDLEATGETPGS